MPEAAPRHAIAVPLALPILLLAGCALGPVWHPPQPAVPEHFAVQGTFTPLPSSALPADAEAPQSFVPATAPDAAWWRRFGNPALDALVDEGLARHPDVDAARAALAQAQAELAAARGQYLAPLVTAQGSGIRQRVPPAMSGAAGALDYNLFRASVGVSYNPDLFGNVRDALEGLGAQVDVQRYQIEAVRLALGGNIATTAFREAGLRAELETSTTLLNFLTAQRDLAAARLQAGAATAAEVLTAEIELDNLVATLPALDKSLAQTRDQLATYVGRPTGEPLPTFLLSDFHLPEQLPLSLPSELARQRPDLRAAEAAMRAANAAVGVAQANRYPSLTLSGALGSSSLTLPGLLQSGNLLWSLGASAGATLFDGGALAAKERAARAAYAQIEAQYRSTVLTALQNVVDALAALQHDARTVDAQRVAMASARASVTLLEQQLALGAATRQQLLVAQINALQAEVPLGPYRAARLADTAALFQALGGGWSTSDAPATAPEPSGTGLSWHGDTQ